MQTAMLSVPIGTIIDYAGATAPTGYLECDGSAVSRSEYSKLFDVLGTLWGAGGGSTTFNLPNLGGRACIGEGTRTVGNTGGSESESYTPQGSANNHTLTAAQIPAHTHGSKTLTGNMNFRSYGYGTAGGGNMVTSTSGIMTNSFTSWSGAHDSVTSHSANPSGYTTVGVNATHEHSSVGGGERIPTVSRVLPQQSPICNLTQLFENSYALPDSNCSGGGLNASHQDKPDAFTVWNRELLRSRMDGHEQQRERAISDTNNHVTCWDVPSVHDGSSNRHVNICDGAQERPKFRERQNDSRRNRAIVKNGHFEVNGTNDRASGICAERTMQFFVQRARRVGNRAYRLNRAGGVA